MRSSVLSLLATLSACSTQGAAIEGEAKDVAGVAQQVSEPLWSRSVQAQICEAIARTSDCSTLSFTVTEKTMSTEYAYLDDASALTMRLRVDVVDPATDTTWRAVLTRAVDPASLRLLWSVDAERVAADPTVDAYIRDIIDEAGEYPDWSEAAWQGRVQPMEVDALPSAVAARLAQVVAECDAAQAPEYPNACGVDSAYAILRDGTVVGYIGEVWETVDHPLHDGSGIHAYFTVSGELVDAIIWTG